MSKTKLVRRIVITPNETYTGAWRESRPDGIQILEQSKSSHPQDTFLSPLYKGSQIELIRFLTIILTMPNGGEVVIMPNIVENSIIITEFEPEVPKFYQDIAQSFTSTGQLVEDWKVERK